MEEMSIPIDTQVVVRDLTSFLHVSSVGQWSLREYDALYKYLLKNFDSKVSDHDLAAAIFAAATLPPTAEYEKDQYGNEVPRWPLRAAKHLLALGAYPDDENEIIEELGRSKKGLQEGDKGIKNLEPLTSNSLRHRMAMIAGGYAQTRRNISEREPQIAYALLQAIKQVVGSPNRKALIRQARQQMQQAAERLASRDAGKASPSTEAGSATVTLRPHLASDYGQDPMALPKLLAPNGYTYRRWQSLPDRENFRKADFWADRLPRDEELFILREARKGPVWVYVLYQSATLRLLMEKFEKVDGWNSGYGPLPLLEAIQTELEERFRDERNSLPSATSLAQAVFLGRLVLDPRKHENSKERVRSNLPQSTHFEQITSGWQDAEIVRNYYRWLIDIGSALPSGAIDWNRRHYGSQVEPRPGHYADRGIATHFDFYGLQTELIRVAKFGVRGLSAAETELPNLQAVMYYCGYDTMAVSSYEAMLFDLASGLPKYREWLLSFFGFAGYEGSLDADWELPRALWSALTRPSARAERIALRTSLARRRLSKNGVYFLLTPWPLIEAIYHIKHGDFVKRIRQAAGFDSSSPR
ncbi:hypothetical protein ABCS02_14100 [Microbacterium sp. X-17]|uniref:hypothetical protein n=1 Tax=Microbacterium sp. X-17 TaxID=3144404 RepID=UPI0031F4CA04